MINCFAPIRANQISGMIGTSGTSGTCGTSSVVLVVLQEHRELRIPQIVPHVVRIKMPDGDHHQFLLFRCETMIKKK